MLHHMQAVHKMLYILHILIVFREQTHVGAEDGGGVLDSDKSIPSCKGDMLAMWPFASLLWTHVGCRCCCSSYYI